MTNSQRWNTIIPYSHKMKKRWAADLHLLPILGNIQLGLAGHQDFLHGNIQQFAECIQVVNGGQALALSYHDPCADGQCFPRLPQDQ